MALNVGNGPESATLFKGDTRDHSNMPLKMIAWSIFIVGVIWTIANIGDAMNNAGSSY